MAAWGKSSVSIPHRPSRMPLPEPKPEVTLRRPEATSLPRIWRLLMKPCFWLDARIRTGFRVHHESSGGGKRAGIHRVQPSFKSACWLSLLSGSCPTIWITRRNRYRRRHPRLSTPSRRASPSAILAAGRTAWSMATHGDCFRDDELYGHIR